MTKIFYCGICKDKAGRSRKVYRNHLSTHIRNCFMNSRDKDNKPKRQSWVSEEDL